MKRASFVMRSLLALRALAVIIVMLTATTARADDSGYCGLPSVHDGQDVSWSYNSTSKTLTISGSGDMGGYYNHTFWGNNKESIETVVIEDGVTRIGEHAFYNCTGLTSVTIPSSVKSIGMNAFDGCSSLTSVTIPKGVTSIAASAFHNCSSMTSIDISSSVTSIGDLAFFKCSKLETITVDKNNTTYDSRDGCNAIIATTSNTLILGCKNTVIPDGVTSIETFAFYRCVGLTSITIPSSVTSIGGGAFADCTSLTSAFILAPELTTYGYDAFYGNASGRKIYVPKGSANNYSTPAHWYSYSNDIIEFDGYCGDPDVNEGKNVAWVLTDEDGDNTKETLTIAGTGAMKNYDIKLASWYGNRVSIKTVVIGNGVTSIGFDAFYGCTSLTSVTIPSSVTSIVKGAFASCTGLTSINIPSSVTNIGDNAFFNCGGLTSINIPASVTSIGIAVFSGCSALETITVDEGNTIYESNGCNAIIEKVGKALIAGCKNTVIPNDVTSIGEMAFYHCTGLTSVTIPSSVTSIGETAFQGCTGLTSITIPSNVSSIGNDAFYDCTNLTDVYCYADPDRLTWNDNNCNDFIVSPDIKTVCHMAGSKLATFLTKWSKGENTDINVIFMGDGIEPGGVDYLVETVTYGSGTAPEGVKTFLPVAYDLSTATVTLAEVTGAPKGMPVIYGSAKVDEKMPDLFFLNYVADDSDDDKAIQDNYDSKAKAMSDRFVITDGKDNLFTILGDIDGVTASDAIFFVLANGKFTRVSVSADDLDKEANPAKPGLLLFVLSKWEYMNMGSASSGSTNAARSIGIGEGGATAIDNGKWIIDNWAGAQWYDLQGRKIAEPTRKGLYIRNGVKVVVK